MTPKDATRYLAPGLITARVLFYGGFTGVGDSERHLLNWVITAKAKLDRTNAPGFPVTMTLLVQFLSHRHKGS